MSGYGTLPVKRPAARAAVDVEVQSDLVVQLIIIRNRFDI
jgi:hypothetical protein